MEAILKKKKSLLIVVVLMCFQITSCGKADIPDKQFVEEIPVTSTENTIIQESSNQESDLEEIPTQELPSETLDTPTVSEDITQNENIQETLLTQTGTLHFIDAWGEWHDADVIGGLKKYPYNLEALKVDGNNVSYTADDGYTVRFGIDVSKWQGKIDFNKVKESGVEFVIIRLGFRGYGQAGNIKEDVRFHENIKAAKEAGLDVGVYFYAQAINEEEALEEAEFVLKTIEGYELDLPVVYDPELIRNDTARTDNVTGEQFTKNTIAFCEAIKAAGYEPMIYSNMIWEAFLFDMSKLQEYKFWYADYEPSPQTPYHFEFWQYSEKGSVKGISGNVDLNIQFIHNQDPK